MITFFYVFFVTVLPMGCETNPLHFMKKEKKNVIWIEFEFVASAF